MISGKIQNEKMHAFLEYLCSAGFLKYVPHDFEAEVRRVILECGLLFPDVEKASTAFLQAEQLPEYGKIVDFRPDGTLRSFFVDSEDLFELGPDLFVREIALILGRTGYRLDSVASRASFNAGVALTINGIETTILSAHELQQGRDSETLHLTRTIAAMNASMADQLLSERLFLLGSGNDAKVIELTEELFNLINNALEIPRDQVPERIRPDGTYMGQAI